MFPVALRHLLQQLVVGRQCAPVLATCLQQQLSTAATPSSWHSLLQQRHQSHGQGAQATDGKWRYLAAQGERLNPCNSPLHPSAMAGLPPEGHEVLSVQEAYTPKSTCFGCGPAHPDGLYLQSRRIQGGLEAEITVGSAYCAFPGIVNGGIMSTLVDCHGNWTAAIALMDSSCLPKPPLTLTASVFLSYKEPTPPNTPLILRSKIVNVNEKYEPGWNNATVEVDVNVYVKADGQPGKLLVSGTVMCKRLGALREM